MEKPRVWPLLWIVTQPPSPVPPPGPSFGTAPNLTVEVRPHPALRTAPELPPLPELDEPPWAPLLDELPPLEPPELEAPPPLEPLPLLEEPPELEPPPPLEPLPLLEEPPELEPPLDDAPLLPAPLEDAPLLPAPLDEAPPLLEPGSGRGSHPSGSQPGRSVTATSRRSRPRQPPGKEFMSHLGTAGDAVEGRPAGRAARGAGGHLRRAAAVSGHTRRR
jgi:hypothetical protein